MRFTPGRRRDDIEDLKKNNNNINKNKTNNRGRVSRIHQYLASVLPKIIIIIVIIIILSETCAARL